MSGFSLKEIMFIALFGKTDQRKMFLNCFKWDHFRHEREYFFAVRDRKGKPNKAFPIFDTGTGNTRNHICSLGRERENPSFIPVKQDGNWKFKSALKDFFFLNIAFFKN